MLDCGFGSIAGKDSYFCIYYKFRDLYTCRIVEGNIGSYIDLYLFSNIIVLESFFCFYPLLSIWYIWDTQTHMGNILNKIYDVLIKFKQYPDKM